MKDLIQLYKFYSVHESDDEKAICDWLVERFKELGVTVQRKDNTIWYFKKGNNVLLSAHLDQVDTNGPAVHFFKDKDGIIKAYNSKWQRTSLGADDKNGIWCILKCVEEGASIDFIISEGEEVGCVGISKVESIIKESTAKLAIVIDRKGNKDILKGGSSDVYCDTLAGMLRNFLNNTHNNEYEITTGSISDTRIICKYIESVNMSANYENAHSKNEVTNFSMLEKTRRNIMSIINVFADYYIPTKPSLYVKTYTSTRTDRIRKPYWHSNRGEYCDEFEF